MLLHKDGTQNHAEVYSFWDWKLWETRVAVSDEQMEIIEYTVSNLMVISGPNQVSKYLQMDFNTVKKRLVKILQHVTYPLRCCNMIQVGCVHFIIHRSLADPRYVGNIGSISLFHNDPTIPAK